jgi:hypothetical protein
VLLMYLPGFLRDDAETALKLAVQNLDQVPDCQLVTKKEGHWRVNEQYFQPRDARRTLPVGAASYSPCWFTMGHPVRHKSKNVNVVDAKAVQAPYFQPKPSGTFRKLEGKDGGIPFIKATQETFQLIGAALRMLHPKQFQTGVRAWDQLLANVDSVVADGFARATEKVLDCWASPFTVAQVIGNRETPLHCDTKGYVGWYDALVTFGKHEKVYLETPSL